MYVLIIVSACLIGTQAQNPYGVKTGNPGQYGQKFQQNATGNLYNRFHSDSQVIHMRQNLTGQDNHNRDVGVCYIEVPTASLARDQAHIPAGNGSSPDLSRIRTCCKGYIRNIHNFWICDPVCSRECVNALCTAPETCTCFPDHVKNVAGFCVATCPIGCQNGHCAGGECLCKEGFKLDDNSKYCLPRCKEDCGWIGNCTEPNTCLCKEGYTSTADGNCKPICSSCEHGECEAPNECRCYQGYVKDLQGHCSPQCSQSCGPNGRCVAPNQCSFPPNSGRQTNETQQPNQLYPILAVNPIQVLNPQTRNQEQAAEIPRCTHPCLNGVCAAGNTCECFQGYVLDKTDSTQSRCIPQCPGGCPNGICTAPHYCICNIGYYKDTSVKGRQTCVKRTKRSLNNARPLNVAELLVFEIPDDEF